MLNFIYGLILILFQLTISIAKGHIDVFPSFIGFGLIAIAFRAHKDKSNIFDGMIYPTAILMVLTAFSFKQNNLLCCSIRYSSRFLPYCPWPSRS